MNDKFFLTYEQQMSRLNSEKHILCSGSAHKRMLVRSGYFNLINGYKMPFTCGTDASGNHVYLPETSLDQIYMLKLFDDRLRSFVLRNITQVEEEVRAAVAYAFDKCNSEGAIQWYDVDAYSHDARLQDKMHVISSAYSELSRSHLDYVKFYMENHHQIPTWIMIKAVNFSTFIDILDFSKQDVRQALCRLYGMNDPTSNFKLLIGSLHWLRKVRNSCAHNERVYSISRPVGRIVEPYISALRPSYSRERGQTLFDLLIYLKYYLPPMEFSGVVSDFKAILFELKGNIAPAAFENVRGQMGVKSISDLDLLASLPKGEIDYAGFEVTVHGSPCPGYKKGL